MSPSAAWRLETLGFTNVYDYVGGKANWFAAGLPREGELTGIPRAGDVARRDDVTCRPTDRIGDVIDRMIQKRMKIGELAKEAGLTAKTIRFYEGVQLLDDPGRTESGYRQYGAEDVERLEFIKNAKRLGLSLDEIRDILKIRALSQSPCVHVRALLDQKLEQVDAVIRQLEEFRQALQQLGAESHEVVEQAAGQPCNCGIIEKGIDADGRMAMAWVERRRK